MKYVFYLLLFTFCFSCEKSDPVVENISDETQAYIIGDMGGWGGGPAYKLEGGQLFRSVENRNLGGPDMIVNDAEFRLLEDPENLQAMTTTMANYPTAVFEGVAPKFDCQEQAWDGTCPYLIVVTEKGKSKGWTASEFDDPSPFIDYMGEVNQLLQTLSE